MKQFILDMLSTGTNTSYARTSSFITLIVILGCTIYDTYINKKLDFALAGLLLAGSTGHYAISKNGENKQVTVGDTNVTSTSS